MRVCGIVWALFFITDINSNGAYAGDNNEVAALRGGAENRESTGEVNGHRMLMSEKGLWKLWFQKNNGWEERGMNFCVQCKGPKGCVKGAELVTNYCNQNDASYRFEFLGTGKDMVQIKVENKNLCATRIGTNNFEIDKCSSQNSRRQSFKGYARSGKFKLTPFDRKGRSVTMHHRPKGGGEFGKKGEAIIDMPEFKAAKSRTLYWEVDSRPKEPEELKLRSKSCSKKSKCKKCEGECKSDSDCVSGLKCSKRIDLPWRQRLKQKLQTPFANVQGCSGNGKYGYNYCYDPKEQ
mmetsp:Transcript_53274/g.159504  ORF Transcript_53274/g.159504 Transcript_53274/m.159504 type:complete len:293 (-) Transcript_53274:250-1128(-)